MKLNARQLKANKKIRSVLLRCKRYDRWYNTNLGMISLEQKWELGMISPNVENMAESYL